MDLPTPIENRANLPDADFATLSSALMAHRSIKHALDWLVAHQPSLSFTDMVTQDEFSHDIIAEYPGRLYLVYDVT